MITESNIPFSSVGTRCFRDFPSVDANNEQNNWTAIFFLSASKAAATMCCAPLYTYTHTHRAYSRSVSFIYKACTLIHSLIHMPILDGPTSTSTSTFTHPHCHLCVHGIHISLPTKWNHCSQDTWIQNMRQNKRSTDRKRNTGIRTNIHVSNSNKLLFFLHHLFLLRLSKHMLDIFGGTFSTGGIWRACSIPTNNQIECILACLNPCSCPWYVCVLVNLKDVYVCARCMCITTSSKIPCGNCNGQRLSGCLCAYCASIHTLCLLCILWLCSRSTELMLRFMVFAFKYWASVLYCNEH